jgi:hypothetical protein
MAPCDNFCIGLYRRIRGWNKQYPANMEKMAATVTATAIPITAASDSPDAVEWLSDVTIVVGLTTWREADGIAWARDDTTTVVDVAAVAQPNDVYVVLLAIRKAVRHAVLG